MIVSELTLICLLSGAFGLNILLNKGTAPLCDVSLNELMIIFETVYPGGFRPDRCARCFSEERWRTWNFVVKLALQGDRSTHYCSVK